MTKNRSSKKILSPPLILAVLSAVYVLAIQYSYYLQGAYGYYDLVLINDWFSNAVYRGMPFYVSSSEASHLGYHFTPSLLVFAPLWWLFSSQFLLLALGTVAMGLATYFLLREIWAASSGVLSVYTRMAILLLVALCFNFTVLGKTVSLSGHFEILITAGVTLLLLSIVRGAPVVLSVGLFCFVLGLRQDVGFFLFFQLAILSFVPDKWFAGPKIRTLKLVLALMAICPVYTLLAVKVFMPYFDEGFRQESALYWAEWGNGWGEIFLNFALHPLKVIQAVDSSDGFWVLNKSYGWIHMLNPLAGLLANLPGVLYYTANEVARRNLWYYNAAMLMPGFVLAAGIGVGTLWRWCALFPRVLGIRNFAEIVVGAAAVLGSIYFIADMPSTHPGSYFPFAFGNAPKDKEIVFSRALFEAIRECPRATKVASSMHRSPFIPHQYERYRIVRHDLADFSLLDSSPDIEGLDSRESEEVMDQLIDSDVYQAKRLSVGGYVAYFRRSSCPQL